ncbi:MAG: 50S ribosomal protein L25 [bacterium]|nr:50S ribosomal protein L25 [bacterium]
MADFTLELQPRSVTGKKVNQLRRDGLVPVTVYGPKINPLTLQVAYRPLEVVLMKAGGTNLIDLTAEGQTVTVLAREVQRDPIKGRIRHVDFFAIDQTSTIRIDVPVHLIGESPAVNQGRGILLQGANTLTIEVLPSKMLHSIEVDLSKLVDVTHSIHVSDLNLGPDVVIINEPEEMIVRVSQSSAARAEEDLEAAEAGVIEPEVIGRGKSDEDEIDD